MKQFAMPEYSPSISAAPKPSLPGFHEFCAGVQLRPTELSRDSDNFVAMETNKSDVQISCAPGPEINISPTPPLTQLQLGDLTVQLCVMGWFRPDERFSQIVIKAIDQHQIADIEDLLFICLDTEGWCKEWGKTHMSGQRSRSPRTSENNPLESASNHQMVERHRRKIHHVLSRESYRHKSAFIHRLVEEVLPKAIAEVPDLFPEDFEEFPSSFTSNNHGSEGKTCNRPGKHENLLEAILFPTLLAIAIQVMNAQTEHQQKRHGGTEQENNYLREYNERLKFELEAIMDLTWRLEKELKDRNSSRWEAEIPYRYRAPVKMEARPMWPPGTSTRYIEERKDDSVDSLCVSLYDSCNTDRVSAWSHGYQKLHEGIHQIWQGSPKRRCQSESDLNPFAPRRW